jgi:hypothetical protein
MTGLVLVGVIIGVLLAYWELKIKWDFRRKFFQVYDSHVEKGTAQGYIRGIVDRKNHWLKSFSMVRKPFSRQINLCIETAGLVMAILGTVSAVVNYDRYFQSMGEGGAVLVSLGLVIGYIPIDWTLGGKVEKEMDAFADDLREAFKRGELDAYLADVRNKGRMDP